MTHAYYYIPPYGTRDDAQIGHYTKESLTKKRARNRRRNKVARTSRRLNR